MSLQTGLTFSSSRGGATFNLPSPNLAETISARLQEVFEEYIKLVIESVRRQLQQRLIPHLKRTVPNRTGALKNSIRFNSARNGFQIVSRFYGAYQNPTVREIVAKWVKVNYRQVLQRASQEAISRLS